ncbi:MAG: GDP-mannose 4,6-dehydratase [Candidatus Nanoarchaeia archaeon]|nr:GDP-mannose 4,6-dehydratase [Candidatus Nanoarchaeia archaeon]
MRVLITGAAGLYGSNLVNLLVKKPEITHIYGVDNFSRNFFNPHPFIQCEELDKKFTLIRKDYREIDTHFLNSLDVDAVIHLAAYVSIDESMEKPQEYFKNNEEATFNFVHNLYNTKNKPLLIYASSPEVYGNPHYVPMDEHHPMHPRSVYAVTKLACEKHCMALYEWYKYPVVVIRNFNTYGENQNIWGHSAIIPSLIEKALLNKDFYITGDGSQTRDFIYVKDAVEAYYSVLIRGKELAGSIFNIGTGMQNSMIDIARKILEYSGSKSKIIFTEKRMGDLRALSADLSRIKQKVGWAPRYSIDEGLKNTIEWYRQYIKPGTE